MQPGIDRKYCLLGWRTTIEKEDICRNITVFAPRKVRRFEPLWQRAPECRQRSVLLPSAAHSSRLRQLLNNSFFSPPVYDSQYPCQQKSSIISRLFASRCHISHILIKIDHLLMFYGIGTAQRSITAGQEYSDRRCDYDSANQKWPDRFVGDNVP
jgi:hypothetical protein